MTKISVIMPVYNDANLINKSINSFLKQTLDDIELICINDGSTDNSLEILKELEKKYNSIKVFSQENQGSGKARNLGINKANGEYIGFLDADDYFIDEDALEKLYNVAKEKDADVVSGNIKLVDTKDNFSQFKHLEYYTKYNKILPEEYGIPWAFYKNIYKKNFLTSNQIYFPDLIRGQDPVFLAEVLSKAGYIYTVPTDVYAYFYIDGKAKCNTFDKRHSHITHFKYVLEYFKDKRFSTLKAKFKRELFSYLNLMGEESAEDNLKSIREVFSDTPSIIKECERHYYYKFSNNPDLLNKLKISLNPAISVIIPVYNAEPFLDESISSILNQTFKDIELVCVNDGSKDNSLKILKEFAKKDSRVKIIDQENGGCGAARNRGLTEATGDYVYFFDPDDYVLPNAFKELYENAIYNDSDLVLFKLAFWMEGKPVDYSRPHFDLDNVFKNVNFKEFSFDYHDIKEYVMNAKAFAPWFKLYKKEFLDKYDDFYFPTNLPFDDVPFHIKSLLRANKISFVPKFFYHYRVDNPNSINNTSSNRLGIIKIIDIVEEFLINEGFFEEMEKEFYNFKIYHTYIYLFRSSNYEEYFQAVKEEYLKIKNEFLDKNLTNQTLIEPFLLDVYKLVLKSNTFDEFKIKFDSYNIKTKYNKTLQENKKLKEENKKLKNKNKKLKKENKQFKSSKSWKITKPLRSI